MTERYIDLNSEIGSLLLEVEKPARYAGGETGSLAAGKEKNKDIFRTLIAFPDLYEIGMGNQALRIIYNRLNNIENILCDRAFAPAPDFEKILRENDIPIYGLDTGISIAGLDMLMFTIGYELALNGILLMLDVSKIPLRCAERNDEHPVIIAGGPAISNPFPFSPFIDAFWIGEAEAGFFDLARELAVLKKEGKGRAEILDKISKHPNIWVKGKDKALRAIYAGFSTDTKTAVFPIPSMKIVQNHGTVEIMRGCPNGCRFCHAGFWYRPMRQKSMELIASQVQEMVTTGGWQEVSLSSLSSGDYSGIDELVENLNQKFSDMHVSFQLPSLKVSTFSLNLLKKISLTRKSGLTFAVETPLDLWQLAINKEVTRDSVSAILEEAKRSGWKGAKFYFMIGLPLPHETEINEEEEIAAFVMDTARRTRMHFNINIGIFIPKAHTPYQRARQIDSAMAARKLDYIRGKLKPMGHKVSVSDTLVSRIEGLLSRGDERAGLLCEKAYHDGSRLDAWNEYINRDVWQKLLDENNGIVDNIINSKDRLPWEIIDSRVTHGFINGEIEKSRNCLRTPSCIEKCSNCGVCGKEIKVTKNSISKTDYAVNHEITKVNNNSDGNTGELKTNDPAIYRILFSFTKHGSAVYHGHLSLIEIFSMSFRRAGIPVIYTQGFNPLVKMEFASPLSTGIKADGEIAMVNFYDEYPCDTFAENLNRSLPEGFTVNGVGGFLVKTGMKKHSLASLLWGFSYINADGQIDYVNAKDEKVYRQNYLNGDRGGKTSLRRKEVLAKASDGKAEWASYFDVYDSLYPKDVENA